MRVDDAKAIKDKAAALEAYARQRKDVEMAAWVSEIKLRAVVRIGELSAELEKAQAHGGKICLPSAGKSKAEALAAAGISTSAAARCELIAKPANRKALEEYIAVKRTAGRDVKIVEALAAVESNARESRNRSALHRISQSDLPPGLHFGDFREKSAAIADECAQLVFTDPPYDAKSASLYEEAARVASRILKPGGSFIAYSGQTQLPEVLAGCAKHLRYWWTIAGVHGGGNQLMQKLGIRCGWKPLVWFVKGTRGDVQNILSDVVTGTREKDAHIWQQAQSEAEYYIEHLTPPRGLVVDFFLGGGTTAAAAQKLGRPWIGFENDAAIIEKTLRRLAKE